MGLLADAISGDTSVALTTMISIGTLVLGSVSTGLVARVTHSIAIKHLTDKIKEISDWKEKAESQLVDLHTWRAATEAVEDALKSQGSTNRGTQPYHQSRTR